MKNRLLGAGVLALVLAGCGPAVKYAGGPADPAATVRLLNAQGQPVGSAVLSDSEEGVRVNLSVRGLPAGTHGVHIHQNGQCAPPDFGSAGPHYNPT
ncbi:MAG TPA: superoxide dismutase family protein, partial [Longimicrobiaceae bacterium]